VTLQQVAVAAPSSSAVRGAAELHYLLEEARVAARRAMDAGDEAAVGPRVLVCGAKGGCGKSTLVQLLANYATRLRYHPLVVDLDTDTPSCGAMPESIALHCLQYPVDITEGYALVPSGLHLHCGSRDFSRNVPLMAQLCRTLSDAAVARQARFPRSRIGGVFVDYPTIDPQVVLEAEQSEAAAAAGTPTHSAAARPHPIDQLIAALVTFDIDVVVVMGGDWLKQALMRRCVDRFGAPVAAAGATAEGAPAPSARNLSSVDVLPDYENPTVPLAGQAAARVFSFPACEHAMPRPPQLKEALRRQQWMRYFFGTQTSPVTPSLHQMDLSKVRFAAVGSIVEDEMESLLPMADDSAGRSSSLHGMAKHVTEVTVADVALCGKLIGRIVAISDANSLRVVPGGQTEPLSYDQFYREVGRCTIAGYGLLREVTATSVVLLTANSGLPLQKNGLTCLLLTDDAFLTTR
jgi:polyribonucleotide 5'-hydroxyl-kinase